MPVEKHSLSRPETGYTGDASNLAGVTRNRLGRTVAGRTMTLKRQAEVVWAMPIKGAQG
jgi:hypothetical protein